MLSRRFLLAAGLGVGFGSGPALAAEEVREEPWNLDGLAGTLALPRGGGRGLSGGRSLGVLIIAGSGPTDRDGNGPGLATDLYRKIALALAAAGHVVLRYDKRGIAGSRALAPREEDLTFPLLQADAQKALLALKARPDVRGVVPLGHSEGALITIRLALAEQVAGLVLMAAPGRSLAVVLTEQIAASGASPELVAEAGEVLAALARGERVARVSPALAPLFRPSVQPYLISELTIDPAADLARVRVPTLILTGGRDLQVSDEDARKLATARPDATVARLGEANHIFKAAPADKAGNIALYRDPAAPLHPGVMPALLAFLAGLP